MISVSRSTSPSVIVEVDVLTRTGSDQTGATCSLEVLFGDYYRPAGSKVAGSGSVCETTRIPRTSSYSLIPQYFLLWF